MNNLTVYKFLKCKNQPKETKMKTIIFAIFTTLILDILANPIETTTKHTIYVLQALEEHEEVPQNAIEVQPDEIHKDIPDDHILKKKIIAMPLSDLQKDTKILTTDQGHAIMAHSTDSSNEDMNTAESSIVFRPLFAYRRKQTSRRRYYVPKGTYNNQQQSATNQEYIPNCNRRLRDTNVIRQYPDWYQNAQFPALI